MIAAWVIGSNGLLGSALQRVLQGKGIRLFVPDERFCWNNKAVLKVQIEEAVKNFSTFVGDGNKWQVYWAAGIGTMNSTTAELALETQTLSTVLGFIEAESGLMDVSGGLAFSSSAGAIYAGSTEDVITENTPVAPTTDYAKEKLKQEDLVRAFALTNDQVAVLIARISTLYGVGQATGKQQGLLAHMARCILRNQFINIYVPLDTIRDYIVVDDAASAISATLDVIKKQSVVTKIIASEKPTTIAEIISIFKRVARRKPKIVVSASKLSALYTRRIQFNSMQPPINGRRRTSLLIGVSQVMAAETVAFVRSRK